SLTFGFKVIGQKPGTRNIWRIGTDVICQRWAAQTAVIAAKAGINPPTAHFQTPSKWIPAFAGMTGPPKGIPSQMTQAPTASFHHPTLRCPDEIHQGLDVS